MISNFINEIMQNPFLALAYGILSALAGFFIGNRLAVDRNRIQEFNKAANVFRDAFLTERFLLDVRHVPEGHEDKTAYQIIEPAIQKHTEAMLCFVEYIPWWKKGRFTHAWDTYIHYKIDGDPNDKPFPAMYAEDKWEGNSSKDLALKRIDKLLSFARPK